MIGPQENEHPVSGKLAYGLRLEIGDQIESTDFYASTSGGWYRVPHVGTFKNPEVVIVRQLPRQPLEAD